MCKFQCISLELVATHGKLGVYCLVLRSYLFSGSIIMSDLQSSIYVWEFKFVDFFFFFWFKLDDVIQNCELCISKKGLLCMEMLKVA